MQDQRRRSPSSDKPRPRRGKNRQLDIFLFWFFLLFPTVCLGSCGFVLYSTGYLAPLFSVNLTATAFAQKNSGCQALIQKAIQASDSFCDRIDSNSACYGNNTINADLEPGTTQKFSERGDIVDVEKVRRISASPIKLDSNEWGIAFLRVIANLPRSQPGQTVTMIVFGNTTLDNKSGNLESFYFTSELGQIVCEKAPKDGIMINVPNGGGVRFMVNGAELILTGDATITAEKNGQMEVSLFEGSGRIVSNGQEQYFGAGQKVDVQLGGENGNESVSGPSAPSSLSQNELDTACALSGQFCTQDQVIPITSENAQQIIEDKLGITPTLAPTLTPKPTFTLIPTRTQLPTFATNTPFSISTWTPTQKPTRTPSKVPIKTSPPIKTSVPVPTNPPTKPPTKPPAKPPATTVPSALPSLTPIKLATSTATGTPITPTSTNTPVTPTNTPIPTPTNTLLPVCGSITNPTITLSGVSNKELLTTITNNTASMLTLNSISVNNTEVLNSITANGVAIWGGPDDGNQPMVVSSWLGGLSDRQISVSGGTMNLVFVFQNPVGGSSATGPTNFEFNLDSGCTLNGNYTP